MLLAIAIVIAIKSSAVTIIIVSPLNVDGLVWFRCSYSGAEKKTKVSGEPKPPTHLLLLSD
jgi:hypothetical protein